MFLESFIFILNQLIIHVHVIQHHIAFDPRTHFIAKEENRLILKVFIGLLTCPIIQKYLFC